MSTESLVLQDAAITVSDLELRLADGTTLVSNVSFQVAKGGSVGLVGESGSGKSLTLKTIIGLLPQAVRKQAGEVVSNGKIGMVFQDPLTALDPLMRVGKQLSQVVRVNQKANKKEARTRATELIAAVKLPNPAEIYNRFPHQLSGGQRQRIVIAMALAADPEILLCDEPTTALDVTVQAQVLALLKQLQSELELTLIFVSHDLAVVSQVCDEILVMSNGEIVERGSTTEIVSNPSHPYTKQLLSAVLEVE